MAHDVYHSSEQGDLDFNCGRSITIEELATFIVNRSLADSTPEAIKEGDSTPLYFDRDTGEPWTC